MCVCVCVCVCVRVRERERERERERGGALVFFVLCWQWYFSLNVLDTYNSDEQKTIGTFDLGYCNCCPLLSLTGVG